MTNVAKALSEFWNSFGVNAYFKDRVPDGATLPYITFDAIRGIFAGASFLTATNWHKNSLSVNEDRAALADKIAQAIPESGVRIPLDGGGFLTMFRNVDFQTFIQDPEDLDVLGVRTSVEVHFYSK